MRNVDHFSSVLDLFSSVLIGARAFIGAFIVLLILVGLFVASRRLPTNDRNANRARAFAAVILVGWFLIIYELARDGFFQMANDTGTPPRLVYAFLGPVIVGLIVFRTVRPLRRVLQVIPQSWLVGIQTYRILGASLLVAYSQGLLPFTFAGPAGTGDILIGLFAPAVAFAVARHGAAAWWKVRIWNALGIADLIMAGVLGFLTTSKGIAALLHMDMPTWGITDFPIVMIPVFAVPLSYVLHIASLTKLSLERKAAAQSNRPSG